MIRSFGDDETELLFHRNRSRHLPPSIQQAAYRKLLMIQAATRLDDLLVPPGNRLEKLKGRMSAYYSIRVNDQWRIKFRWSDGEADDVTLIDYHS